MVAGRSPNANNRIFWVTDNDDPVKGNTQLIEVLRRKRSVGSTGTRLLLCGGRQLLTTVSHAGQDATESGYAVETFFVPPTFDSDFDLEKFYGVRT